MIASLFWTLAGLAGAGGGLWIAALFMPTVAALLKAALDFLKSPLGTVAGLLGLVAVLYVAGWIAGDVHGSNAVRSAWRADVAAKSKAAAVRELALRADMQKLADQVLAYDGVFSKHIDDKVSTYVAKTPDVACRRATDADVGRLLSIR
ncbi:hypothetical protein [Bradyrhizobium sp. SZCCHNR1093]|uniref:hypothetical protein n=1 Tax=Bradyrhizobium sp. SZCCHNR1093 TaxID=3057368 RepID=UPI0028E32678|nr:hypothetical protein [Bradyrhizobium sp. SZCCHNR1093]